MTTRAGLAGLGTGILLIGLLFYPLYILLPGLFVEGWPGGSWVAGGILLAAGAALVVFGGCLGAHWSGVTARGKRAWLGALAGGLAATLLFCSLGAGAAGVLGLGLGFEQASPAGIDSHWTAESVLRITTWTHAAFWGLLLSGMLLGALGSLLRPPAALARRLTPWPRDPQMGLNAAITAMPSSAVAVMLVAVLFSILPGMLRKGLEETGGTLSASPQMALDWPLTTTLLLYLGSQLALGLVTRHEALQVTHLCGIDEVKMAAYVGIAVPLLVTLVLGLVDWHLLFKPLVIAGLLLSLGMAAWQVMVLSKLILPRRAQMEPPADRLMAALFGTIANSHRGGLLLLCLGCGMLMAAPIYIAVVAPAINISWVPVSWGLPLNTLAGWSAANQAGLTRQVFAMQAKAGLGMGLVAALLLVVIYMFYTHLGRLARRLRGGP